MSKQQTAAPSEVNAASPAETLPKHVEQLTSGDGSVKIGFSPYGGQVWSIEIAGRKVLYELTRPHSTGRDTRPNPNSEKIGETTRPGGTWLSFGESKIIEADGTVREMPVHGPFSPAWNRYSILERGGHSVVMKAASVESEWFREGEGYNIEREVAVVQSDAVAEGEVLIATTVTSTGESAFAMPEAAEHAYFVSGRGASVLNSAGGLTTVEEIDEHGRHEPKNNGNAIDSRFNSTLTGTPGTCVFLPNGENGHVVVIEAVAIDPDGNIAPVETFCVYRYKEDDPWTAIEPVVGGAELKDGQSLTMVVSIRTYKNLQSYLSS